MGCGADLTTSAGKSLLVMATEAAYAGAGVGQESAFDCIRIRVNVAQQGDYVVTYPYGRKTYSVTSPPGVRFRDQRHGGHRVLWGAAGQHV